MLGDQLVSLTELERISPETIRQRLKDNDLKPWQKKMWCIGQLDAVYIARMEHILDLYAESADPKRPVINFDEAGKQLVAHVNEPISMKPGKVAKMIMNISVLGWQIFLCFLTDIVDGEKQK